MSAERVRSRSAGVTTVVIGVVSAVWLLLGGAPSFAQEPSRESEIASREDQIQARFEAVRHDPGLLRALLRTMPKGGELHSHLSGAVRTERLIEWGAEDGVCDTTATLVATEPPCEEGQVPLAHALSDPVLYDAVLRAWSM